MADSKIPYVAAYGNITKALEKIKKASTPAKFSQDFLATKLDMKGGSAKPVIPFLKKTGFLASDGAPTALYERFRNDHETGSAAADALRVGFGALYDVNEYVHEATDNEIKGLIVQVTGSEKDSSTVGAILGSFKALKAFADFDAKSPDPKVSEETGKPTPVRLPSELPTALNLGYTINLHLPATSDIAVFNAIFKSLTENLLRA